MFPIGLFQLPEDKYRRNGSKQRTVFLTVGIQDSTGVLVELDVEELVQSLTVVQDCSL